MKTIKISLLAFYWLISIQVNAQNNLADQIPTKYLSVGDMIPEILLKQVRNYTSKQARISEFRGKLLILDFWGVNCKACLEGMPKMDSLQKEFGEKIQVLLVTRNTKDEVDRLLSKRKKLADLKLISIEGDSVLSSLFAFVSFPTHVWVDESGVVLYITDGWNAKAGLIEKVLKGERPELRLKYEDPSFGINETETATRIIMNKFSEQSSYSAVSPFINGYMASGLQEVMDPALNKPVGLTATNIPLKKLIVDIYRNYYSAQFNFIHYNNRTIIENDTSIDLRGPSKNDIEGYNKWYNDNKVCYNLRSTRSTRSELYALAVEDIKRYWKYEADVQWREKNCLILVKTGHDSLLAAREAPGIPQHGSIKIQDGRFVIKNRPLNALMLPILTANNNLATPLIDGTNYKGKIDLEIAYDFKNIPHLKKELNKFGLDLVEKEIFIEMFIIKKINNSHKKLQKNNLL